MRFSSQALLPNQSDDIELAYQYALGNLISKTEAFELCERLSKELVVN